MLFVSRISFFSPDSSDFGRCLRLNDRLLYCIPLSHRFALKPLPLPSTLGVHWRDLRSPFFSRRIICLFKSAGGGFLVVCLHLFLLRLVLFLRRQRSRPWLPSCRCCSCRPIAGASNCCSEESQEKAA